MILSFQEAVLDIALEFKDGTILPLSLIDPEEYDLRVTSVNNDIVEVKEMISTVSFLPPTIMAVGDGKGEIIKVMLKERNSCERKKPRTLDTEYVHVQVRPNKSIFFLPLLLCYFIMTGFWKGLKTYFKILPLTFFFCLGTALNDLKM